MTATDNDTTRAATIVADWLTGLWVSRPTWINRMPDKEHVDQLVSAIAANIPKRAATEVPSADDIAKVIRSLCFVHIQSVEGKTLPTENIAAIEVHGIEVAAEEIVRRYSPDSGEVDRLRERCLAYKGQVEAGSIAIQHLQGEIARMRDALTVCAAFVPYFGDDKDFARRVDAARAALLTGGDAA